MYDEVVTLSLKFGRDSEFQGEILARRLIHQQRALPAEPDVAAAVAEAMRYPIDFPDPSFAFVPGDRVVIALERDTPEAASMIAALWKILAKAGVLAADVTILLPAAWDVVVFRDPRSELPAEQRDQVVLKQHDPMIEGECSYLATTSTNERIYLNRDIVDADIVIPIGPAQFDAVLGVRGTASGLFPGMSDAETLRSKVGQGHDELGPQEIRQSRQTVDEVGYLLGLQFSIAVVPASGGGVHRVLTGISEGVLSEVRKYLMEHLMVEVEQRAEMVLVTLREDAGGHGWSHVGAALDAARKLVERDGRIVLMTAVNAPLSPGLQLVKESRTPTDAIRHIRKANPVDLLASLQIAQATDWANVYLLSELSDELVEDLFMVPLTNVAEVNRLIQSDDSTIVLEDPQFVFTRCVD